eukprot:COSAG01_NODE_2471_length_7630_cov_3.056566_15_plen_177_part_00
MQLIFGSDHEITAARTPPTTRTARCARSAHRWPTHASKTTWPSCWGRSSTRRASAASVRLTEIYLRDPCSCHEMAAACFVAAVWAEIYLRGGRAGQERLRRNGRAQPGTTPASRTGASPRATARRFHPSLSNLTHSPCRIRLRVTSVTPVLVTKYRGLYDAFMMRRARHSLATAPQ